MTSARPRPKVISRYIAGRVDGRELSMCVQDDEAGGWSAVSKGGGPDDIYMLDATADIHQSVRSH
eukprot:scaffold98147_cov18-Prasinocladus_malaysianus.AAC.1